jgi:ubiquinone/menaquinone biosynthesis C-methylase UbiE
VNAANVEFRLGEIEHLPVADASIDVILSNRGVLRDRARRARQVIDYTPRVRTCTACK